MLHIFYRRVSGRARTLGVLFVVVCSSIGQNLFFGTFFGGHSQAFCYPRGREKLYVFRIS